MIDQMKRQVWRSLLPSYLAFVLAFPLGMAWVESHPANGPTICLFRLITHLDCPGCGLTRAFRAMGRLDVLEAFRYNPLGPPIFLAVLFCWFFALAMLITGGGIRIPSWWTRRREQIVLWGAVLFLLVGTVRLVYELHHPPPPPIAPWIHLDWPRLPGFSR